MDEEDVKFVERVRRIAKDTFYEIMDAEVVPLLQDFSKVEVDAARATDLTKLPFDLSKIHWQRKTGEKGEFELSENYDSPHHKALLKFLNDHAGGRASSEGWFIWVFQNGSTIGRKWKGRKQ